MGKLLEKKVKVYFKISGVATWESNNYKHILPNISKSKGDQTMKVDLLITRI